MRDTRDSRKERLEGWINGRKEMGKGAGERERCLAFSTHSFSFLLVILFIFCDGAELDPG